MNEIDEFFMEMALNEARNCYSRGDLPVGAVLTIDDKVEGSSGNSTITNRDWISHAENSLLHKVSWKIKNNPEGIAKLYTTWEPCFMCTGAAMVSRVDEIIYSCQDPIGGMSKTNLTYLGEWNKKHWPKFREGPFRHESYNLLVQYMEKHKEIWGNFLEKFKTINL
jgi:tRNA(adenine34) deaminase